MYKSFLKRKRSAYIFEKDSHNPKKRLKTSSNNYEWIIIEETKEKKDLSEFDDL